ncbi:MAG: preprotein translocase subunit YajC [Clostridia bacterium]|nr:preprotein translocase subunit YajC [Clostridia bacterium]
MKPWEFMLIYVVGVVILLYFLTILPGKRKNKKTRQMHDAVKAGDTISTIGGIIGTVTERDGDTVVIRIDEKTGTTMRIVIFAVQSVIEQADA